MKLGEITVFFTVLEFTDEDFPMATVDVYVQPFTACKMKSKRLIIYIIRVAYLQEGKKINASCLIQIKLKTIKRKQMALKPYLTLNYNSSNKGKNFAWQPAHFEKKKKKITRPLNGGKYNFLRLA